MTEQIGSRPDDVVPGPNQGTRSSLDSRFRGAPAKGQPHGTERILWRHSHGEDDRGCALVTMMTSRASRCGDVGDRFQDGVPRSSREAHVERVR